jgi:hypothetical protein
MEIQIMHLSNRNRESIVITIENSDLITYQSPILDHIWKLLPGFIVWKIWKERSKRISHSLSSSPSLPGKRSSLSFDKQLELNPRYGKTCNAILHKVSSYCYGN